jgi:hypothetical protein
MPIRPTTEAQISQFGSPAAIQQVSSLTLPCTNELESTLLHSIVQDEAGNVYYSDEFNHAVGSLDKAGRLRWVRQQKGSVAGQFYYPMGMTVGFCSCQGEIRECLGICDAWNNRVQFVDPDGRFLDSWTTAGNVPFAAVCEIRFIRKPFPREDGYWLVLDRGNHRLCALDLDGKLKFQLGQAFSPKMESEWIKEGLEPLRDPVPAGMAHAYRPFDPIFYPTRILGKSEHSIYLYEAISGRLKQPFLGNLFPLDIQRPVDSEWVAADEYFFVAWSRNGRRLSWFDHTGQLLCEAETEGTPVASDRPAHEFWMQSGNQLRLWQLVDSSSKPQRGEKGKPFSALWHAAIEEFSEAERSRQSPCAQLSSLAESFLGICDELLEQADRKPQELSVLRVSRDRASAIFRQLKDRNTSINEEAHKAFLAALKIRLLYQCRGDEHVDVYVNEARNLFIGDGRKIENAILHAARCLKRTYVRLRQIQKKEEDSVQEIEALLKQQYQDILDSVSELLRWSGTRFRYTDLVKVPEILPFRSSGSDLIGPGLGWIGYPQTKIKRDSCWLNEVDRFCVVPAGRESYSNPTSMVRASDGTYFVGISEPGNLLQLDREGRVIRELLGADCPNDALQGPADMSFDAEGRLWILENLGHRIRVVDLSSGTSSIISCSPDSQSVVMAPLGICCTSAGVILIADSKTDSVLSVTDTGSFRKVIGGSGDGPGEFLYPISIFNGFGNTPGAFWVVDQGNHRLQRFDLEGRFVSQIQSCETGSNFFLLPHRAAQFSDGTLVVSYRYFDQCLRLLSPEGEELDQLFLDFKPGGIRVYEDLLFVTEWRGQHVRLYQRRR